MRQLNAWRFDSVGRAQMPMHPVCKPLIIRLSEAEVGEAFSLGAGVEGEHELAVRAQDHLRREVETGGVCPRLGQKHGDVAWASAD